jgi:glycosyltransferase involved in cell wall biosynthesis
MPDLAVIMSVYQNDKLKFLRESIQSIIDQTFAQFHYYIVFDGQVARDIDTYIESIGDNRIKLFRLEGNRGLAGALNYLLKIILMDPEYTLIARMDADDISNPLRFERQRNFLLDNPEVSCVGCWYEEIDESGRHLSDRKLPTDHETLKKRYYTRTPFAHPSVMYRRQLIEKAGYYPTDTVLMEDNVLWGRALKAGLRFANIPIFLFQFRIDEKFFKRRSGFKYGKSFIKTRCKINRSLKFPLYSYLFILLIGFVKLMPPFFLRYVYLVVREK